MRQFDRVILGEAFHDPVVVFGATQPGDDVHQFVRGRAGAVAAQQRPVGMQVQRTRPGQAATPHRIAGLDQQQARRQLAEGFLQLRAERVDEREQVVAMHAFAARRRDGDPHAGDALAAHAQLAGEQPAFGPVDASFRIDDHIRLAVATARVRRLDAPAFRQRETQACARVGAAGDDRLQRRHQVVAAKQRPVAGHARVEAVAAAAVVHAYPVLQGAALARRCPGDPVAVAFQRAVGLDPGVAVRIEPRGEADETPVDRRGGDHDVGGAVVGLERDPVVDREFRARGQRRQGQQRSGEREEPPHRRRAHSARNTAVAAATLRLSTAPLPGIDRRRSQASASAGSMPSPSAPST